MCARPSETPKVGAECPNWARSDLCGGRPVMDVPTAKIARKHLQNMAESQVLTFCLESEGLI